MQATARVLEINCQVIYIPGVMLISFGDAATHTSDIKFLKQANGLDLGKLLAAYLVYYNVIYDKISVTEASVELDELMIAGPKYSLWQNMVIGAFASAFIQPSGVSALIQRRNSDTDSTACEQHSTGASSIAWLRCRWARCWFWSRSSSRATIFTLRFSSECPSHP